MAATRLTSVLRVAPAGLLVVLEAWVLVDLLSVEDAQSRLGLGIVWLANVLLFAAEARVHWRAARWGGYVALGSAYLLAHTLAIGVQLVPALVFLVLLIGHAELRILAERFTSLFAAAIGQAERRKVGTVLARALLRLSIALALAIVVPLVTADVAEVGLVPTTTIPTLFLLSAGLVAVVLLLALLPSLEPSVRDAPRGRGTKDN